MLGFLHDIRALRVSAHGNPRKSQVERFRQRFMHKLVYFPANNDGMYSCVGCGRCVAKCPISMNIVKVAKALGSGGEKVRDEYETGHIDPKDRGHYGYQKGYAGRKNVPRSGAGGRRCLSAHARTVRDAFHSGVGEAMFSITSSPTNTEYMEFSIKKCGCLTDWLHQMDVGQQITIRGPYGDAFPVETELKGKDLLFIAGGIGLAPLRSVINYVRDITVTELRR